jgi:hypothetical protein
MNLGGGKYKKRNTTKGKAVIGHYTRKSSRDVRKIKHFGTAVDANRQKKEGINAQPHA